MSFRLDTAHEVPPNGLDIAILRKAKALLADADDWDRQDDRLCTPDKPGLSLHCALRKATISESGGFHHRRSAMQIVRKLVDVRSAGRDCKHRLRDYDNDPRTTPADLQSLFDEAILKAQAGQAADTAR
ncbi:MAG TPA: hypothetical protein VN043_15390 [Rhodanobacter sp.]|nr:hypothetical protein [Rhodanobacter sp.]